MIADMRSDFRLMGVINVTPDSFSDGGSFLEADAAIAQGRRLAGEGADLLDVGGESTRPGAEPVDAEDELARVLPVVAALVADETATLSIDTSKRPVAEAALDAGARYVNDVTAFRADPGLAGLVADRGVECCLMHMLGEPRTMQDDPRYADVVSDVKAFLEERLAFAVGEGIREDRIALDPGIGFGKTVDHNLQLLRDTRKLAESLGRPLVVGTSRKGFIKKVTGDDSGDRLFGTAATVAWAVANGAAVVRVHDVGAMAQVVRMTRAILRGGAPPISAP